ncbi:PPOX class F420-dependent oxidoreductase [Fodinicola acaciae]|uniref:PPOX class F420-dependent oxidoreductase n=1 Tax=Fodinicola acaciae TaxID=2681555 RepID=UPI0013D4445F|nr:PPOX class F420-dependent oxidoreductase [Fodinicola acaciae]
MSFTEEELAYLRSQPLGRLATVATDGQPDNAPVGFEVDGPYVYVGGMDPATTRKWKNIAAGNEKVCLVVDDLASTDPWAPRFVRIYGTADLVERQSRFPSADTIRITPTISWSWNLDGKPFSHDNTFGPRRTVHG